jgi:protein SCO1/2
LAVIAAIVSSSLPAWGQAPDNPHAGHMAMAGGDMPPPVDDGIVVDFTLVDRDGNTVSDEDFRGRYVLLGFGFTHCEHICPLMALNMGQVVENAAKPATGLFVSVDTERDTAAVSDDYAQHFGESMLGLGGSIEQINAAARNFKVSYAVTKTQDHYTVQHTANVFLIDPRGELVDVFAFSDGPDRILESMD